MGKIEGKIKVSKKGKEVLIRSAELSDVARILEISRQVMGEQVFMITQPDEYDLTLEQGEQRLGEYLSKPSYLWLVAEISGQVVAHLHFKNGHRRRLAHSGEFVIACIEEIRSSGIGTLLVESLLAWAEENEEIEIVWLQVSTNNPGAIAFYEKFGFEEYGILNNGLKYGPNHYADILFMRKVIKQK